MRRISVSQFSLVGLALMSVAAITAAFTTSKPIVQTNSANNGTLRNFSGGGGDIEGIISCITAHQVLECHKTAIGMGLIASQTGNLSIYVNALGQHFTTIGNTSYTTPGNNYDTTSILYVYNPKP